MIKMPKKKKKMNMLDSKIMKEKQVPNYDLCRFWSHFIA